MSAILPFLEQQNDEAEGPDEEATLAMPADLSEEIANIDDDGVTFEVMSELQGLGRVESVEPFQDFPVVATALEKTHSELLRTAFLREPIVQALMENSYTVRVGKLTKRKDAYVAAGHEVHFWLDKPVGLDPRWNPAGTGKGRFYQMLTWTSKMGCPSFSLPAGPTTANGSCPGANGAQTIVPLSKLRPTARTVEKIIGKPVRLQQAICQYCYAESGRYATGQIQFAQMLNYMWTRARHQHEDWFETMIYAIEFTDYVLDGGSKANNAYGPETYAGRFFRIHDSGDFFSRTYVEAWDRIAHWFSEENFEERAAYLQSTYGMSYDEIRDNHPPIIFWAPTRCWATPWGIDAVNKVQSPNLIIRASAYHVNEPAPGPEELGPGWADGSVVYHVDEKGAMARDVWDCPTYRVEKETASCRNAINPDGQEGCRACWLLPAVVNYTLH